MKKREYDFAGWVTKSDIECSDGITIKHDAFSDDDGRSVPLVWNHDHNSPENILGTVELENRGTGVYGYGRFNNTDAGQQAKQLVEHGDISAMSIFAKKLKQRGQELYHGAIKEVSLVLAGANPGAMIDYVNVAHGEDNQNGDEAVIWTGFLIHAASDVVDEKEETKVADKDTNTETAEKTVEEVFGTMNEEQQAMVGTLIEGLIEEYEAGEVAPPEGDAEVKHNVFNNSTNNNEDYISHDEINGYIKEAFTSKASLKDTFMAHSITGIEVLFPEARAVDAVPQVYGSINTATKQILAAIRKVPFQKVKTVVADFTEKEARARGYIKAHEKFEQVYKLMKRETGPQTIYKKQKLDRDDVIDVEEFDIVAFTNAEMRGMLDEEIARAVLVGDGREVTDPDKIQEDKIRPIISDDDFFTIKTKAKSAADVLETVIKVMGQYRGSGSPTMYIQPNLLADMKLVKATDGRYLFGDIPTNEAMAARLGVGSIVPTTFFGEKQQLVIVNLHDYTIGAAKGGQVTTFDDFDIDFNQMKYLIETRLSGALTRPKSAIRLDIDSTYTSGTTTADTGTASTTMKYGTVVTGGPVIKDETPEEPVGE